MLRKDDRKILDLLKHGARTHEELMIRVYDNNMGSNKSVQLAIGRLMKMGAPINKVDGKYQLFSDEINLQPLKRKKRTYIKREKLQPAVLELLKNGPKTAADLCRHLGVEPQRVYATISHLRTNGESISLRDGYYSLHDRVTRETKPTLTKLAGAKADSDAAVELVKMLRDLHLDERNFALRMAAAMYGVEL